MGRRNQARETRTTETGSPAKARGPRDSGFRRWTFHRDSPTGLDAACSGGTPDLSRTHSLSLSSGLNPGTTSYSLRTKSPVPAQQT